MKSLDFLKEGFVEDASEAHQDHEVQMARQECFNTAENALALHKLLRNISEAQGLEGWVSSKITLANDYLKRVREYLEYEFLTKDINEITPQITIAENAESKKKLIEYKIVSGQEGKTQNYVITGLDTKTLDQLARAYYGAIKLEQDPKKPNVTTIIWDLPTAGPTPYGSYDAKSGTATFIKKMTDVGDQLAKSVKSVERSVEMEEGLDLDQQAMTVADRLTSGKNLEKLQAMRHDSTVYRALDRYFANNNIPENIYNRVANIVFKRINTQGVAEGKKDPDELSRYENDVKTLLANGDIKTAKKVAGLSPDAAHRNHLRNIIRHYDSKQGVADGSSFQTDQMVSHISQIIKGLEGGGDKNTYMKLVAREMPHIVQSNPKLFRRAFGIAYDRFFHIDQDDDFDYTDDSMRQGEKGIAKGMDVVSVKEQGVADGSDKTFTVKYYSKKTGRNVTRQIKASSESELWDRLRTKGIDVVSVKEQGVAEQQDDPYRTNTEQNMDSVAQFEVGQKVIFTSPLNNKKYEAVVKNIWPDTGSIEVFIPLGDQGGGLGTFASPKNLQPMQQEVAEGKKCNHTMEGTQCPVHGLSECPMQENKKLKETSAGSVAGVNNPPGKNSGKKKSQIGSLFGGTYKQTVHETDFAGEKTTPPQKPGDQVRGTEKPIKKGKQQPFYHRLVGNE